MKMIRFAWLLGICTFFCFRCWAGHYRGDDPRIRYMGRIEMFGSQPRLWTGGAYFSFRFKGDTAMVILEDEVRYGVQHNYMEIQVDNDRPIRLRLNKKIDTIYIVPATKSAVHNTVVCKDTETGIGYVGVNGIVAEELLPLPKGKKLLFEFYGDSITCGASSDTSSVGCHAGRWEDQHNGYMAYGAQLARMEDADWIMSSVSGIGLMHSCCDMKIVMPEVWRTMDMHNDSLRWDFKYSPNVVFVCLGQNDGIQDKTTFRDNYVDFLQKLRMQYLHQPIVLLSSPMADTSLRQFLKMEIESVLKKAQKKGMKKLYSYVFEQNYNSGCDAHPSIAEHTAIAAQLDAYLKKEKGIL
ncbi:MAG: GDSL-type esterase/lipase family protein [Chitinophagaceae bacterium]